MTEPDFSLAAGPTMPSRATLSALGSNITYHYDPAFLETFRNAQTLGARFLQTKNDVLLLQGEGILGLEAAARSLVVEGMHVLNLVQGLYGKGMGYWLAEFGGILHEIEVPYNDVVTSESVDAYLSEHPEIELVTFVHSETPSGTMTDASRMGPIIKKHGALSLVDALSSAGGAPLKTDEWGLDVVVSGGQKCLGGPVGVTIMSVSEAAWDRALSNDKAPRASYVSMVDWKLKWLDQGVFPFTPSVTDILGIESALTQLLDEGLDVAIARHAFAAGVARAGVKAMGLEFWAVKEEYSSDVVTGVKVPAGIDAAELSAHIRERYGVMLSHGGAAGNLIHVTHMGPSARGMYTMVSLSALGRGLLDLGADIQVGKGLEAALAELSK